MLTTIQLKYLDTMTWANEMVITYHYLHTPPDVHTMPIAYAITLDGVIAGVLIFGRPEATRCYPWYGSVDDVREGRCEVTRWQVLNLSRVLVFPAYQPGGNLHNPIMLPGFTDRRGVFRSTLLSTAINQAMQTIGLDYLLRWPPVFLQEPYQIIYLMSYCNTRLHRGTIYKVTGFERYRTNKGGIETYRIRLPDLTKQQHQAIHTASRLSPRAIRHRDRRAQLKLGI